MSNHEMQRTKHRRASIFFVYLIGMLLAASFFMPGNEADARLKLKSKEPAICYSCHDELRKGLSDRYVHFLFKKGKCITCHNSHVSRFDGLLEDELERICLNCHEDIKNLIEKGNLHGALRDTICSDCHYAHSGNIKHLLVKEEKDLCKKCHEDLEKQLQKPYLCTPFKEGKCSSCHDSHASMESDLLIAPPNTLCQECHQANCRADNVNISSITKKLDCTTCHTGHSSFDKGLLGPYGHKAFLNKNCQECHEPIVAKRKIVTKIQGTDLCYSCHKEESSEHQYNDNDVHVKDKKNACIMCHDHHASGKENLTMNETALCTSCHQKIERMTMAMEKVLKATDCEPIKDRKCFGCHSPMHSDLPLNLKTDPIQLCSNCHEAQHKITHPLGDDAIDSRNGQPMDCLSCHSMHDAREDYFLTHDRQRALCIQCHKL
ncbi:MAG: cytochrome c3 family protein [Nitrospirota bacterium]